MEKRSKKVLERFRTFPGRYLSARTSAGMERPSAFRARVEGGLSSKEQPPPSATPTARTDPADSFEFYNKNVVSDLLCDRRKTSRPYRGTSTPLTELLWCVRESVCVRERFFQASGPRCLTCFHDEVQSCRPVNFIESQTHPFHQSSPSPWQQRSPSISRGRRLPLRRR